MRTLSITISSMGAVPSQRLPDTPMTFAQLAQSLEKRAQGKIVLARVGNQLFELSHVVPQVAKAVTLIDTTDTDGYRVYMRSLSFVFLEAVHRLFPDTRTVIEHSISGGLYCVIQKDDVPVTLDTHQRDALRCAMREIIDEDIPIVRETMTFEEAKQLFRSLGRQDKVAPG